MSAALVLGLACGLVASWIADWLPARIDTEGDSGTPPIPPSAAVVPGRRAIWRLALLVPGSMALAVYLYLAHSWSAYFWAQFPVSEVLLLIAVIDLEHQLVPNILVASGLAMSLLSSALTAQPGLRSAVIGSVVAAALFLAIAAFGRGALGAGDVKLAVLIGTVNGFPQVLQALVMGILLGGMAAGVLLLTRLRGPKQYIPYAPYLVAGCLSTLLFGQHIARWWQHLPVWGG